MPTATGWSTGRRCTTTPTTSPCSNATAQICAVNRLGTTPLFDAVRGGCPASVEAVVRQEGRNVLDHTNLYDCTAMHWACKHVSLPGAQALHGLDPGLLNRPNRRGCLPLDVLEWRELYHADLARRTLGRPAGPGRAATLPRASGLDAGERRRALAPLGGSADGPAPPPPVRAPQRRPLVELRPAAVRLGRGGVRRLVYDLRAGRRLASSTDSRGAPCRDRRLAGREQRLRRGWHRLDDPRDEGGERAAGVRRLLPAARRAAGSGRARGRAAVAATARRLGRGRGGVDRGLARQGGALRHGGRDAWHRRAALVGRRTN